jgi:hypothetical protein
MHRYFNFALLAEQSMLITDSHPLHRFSRYQGMAGSVWEIPPTSLYNTKAVWCMILDKLAEVALAAATYRPSISDNSVISVQQIEMNLFSMIL